MELFSIYQTYVRAAVRKRFKGERGASLVEYALLLVLIGILCIGAITLVGDTTNSKLSSSGSRLSG